MASAKFKRVVVVVPTFTKRQNTYGPVVPRQVARVELLRAPAVGDGVYGPGDVIHPHGADAEPPNEPRQATDGVQRDRRGGDVPHVRLLHEAVKRLRGELLRV